MRSTGRDNVELVFGDALTLSLDALDPPPTKLVANLPYQIATPLVVESLDGLPAVELWCVMVQREVGRPLLRRARDAGYGAVSVLVQLTAERAGFHPVARTVFRPPPQRRLRARRLPAHARWGPEYAHLKEVVQAAFAHRRKTLANSLELARGGRRARSTRRSNSSELPEGVRAPRRCHLRSSSTSRRLLP